MKQELELVSWRTFRKRVCPSVLPRRLHLFNLGFVRYFDPDDLTQMVCHNETPHEVAFFAAKALANDKPLADKTIVWHTEETELGRWVVLYYRFKQHENKNNH